MLLRESIRLERVGICQHRQIAHVAPLGSNFSMYECHCRDLKTKNILLNTAGEAKIADVGLAKLVGSQLLSTQLETAGLGLGLSLLTNGPLFRLREVLHDHRP